MLIDGDWCDAADGKYFSVYNQRDEQLLGQVPAATAADVEKAVRAADAAFSSWANTSPFLRGKILRAAADLVMERSKLIGRLMALEQGKPLAEASGEVTKSADILRYYAEEGERVCGRIISSADMDTSSRVIYQPVGAAAAISPWNYPVELLAWKVGAALAAGCTLVCKLPSETPLSPLAFLECLHQSGVPAGVINGLTGSGSKIGSLLTGHPQIRKVAFTGSTVVGREVLGRCTDNLTRASLELGGSLPLLVFADCNLDEAVKGAVRRSFRNNGQVCIAINRIYVQREIYEEFINRFTSQVKGLRIGEGIDLPADLGPMCTSRGRDTVQRHIDDALAKGANLRCGGKVPAGFTRGYWFEPTILSEVSQNMLIMQEETFGPAVGVMPFDTMDQAIELANDTPYGLAAIVYTQRLATAEKCIMEIQAGNIAVNNPDPGVINAPYGGIKESGFGKEHGPEAIYEYMYAKHVRMRILSDER